MIDVDATNLIKPSGLVKWSVNSGIVGVPIPKGTTHVAKPNYQFEKRQRELEKKKKKAEKAQRKASAPDVPPPSEEAVPEKSEQSPERPA